MAGYLDLCEIRPAMRQRELRFDRLAITSVFGDPLNPTTWSGAPFRLASALRQHGVSVEGFQPRLSRARRVAGAARHIVAGFGKLRTSEQFLRCAPARNHHANEIAAFIARRGIRHVLHTGTLDLPAFDLLGGIKHYLYCDHTWSLALPWRLDAGQLNAKAVQEYERLERESLLGLEHIFTFGGYVRDEIIRHYGISPDRVTAVGSGMGEIDPYFDPRSYATPNLLFIAKHLFRAKGGELLIDAFFRAQHQMPDLTLTIVGDKGSQRYVPRDRSILFRGRVPWIELQRLYRMATLLAQPMLNDPWGQVFLEALVSRTPVLGLERHGLPEIIEGGRHGFLVAHADPAELAEALLEALRDPDRLAAMGRSGQRHVMNSYSWDRVAARIAFV
jgi:glycosyltransferase involved in cell wall biosynthesis